MATIMVTFASNAVLKQLPQSLHHPKRKLHTTFASYQSSQGQKTESSSSSGKKPNVVLIDAVRTPFVLSNTVFRELLAVDLQRHALKGTGILCISILLLL